MYYKTILKFFAVVAYLAGCNWLYNHVNPWLGIVLIVALFTYLINDLFTYLKKF